MKLELKSIQYNAALSEETYAYSAKLYADGKHVADVANRGHGGCDEQYWRDHSARQAIEAYLLPCRNAIQDINSRESRSCLSPISKAGQMNK